MTPEPPAIAGQGNPGVAAARLAVPADRRLHPMSWLFVLLQQLKHFVLPLIAAFFFGGDRNELWPLIGVGGLVLVSVWRYFTYRYGVGTDALVVRSGVLERSLRVIPFARIHNVAVQQSVLHRLFGVAEVRLESAGGQKPEAEMRVLKLSDALALEALVRRRGALPGEEATSATTQPTGTLLRLSTAEVVRVGLVSNRGLIVVGAAVGAVSQFESKLSANLIDRWGETLLGWALQQGDHVAFQALALTGLLLAAVAALRLLSILLALLQYHGFTLAEHEGRVTVERGLLARWRTSASRRRIQAWTLREGVVHRLLRRRSLEVDTAVGEQRGGQRALRELAPIATVERCDELIEHFLPRGQWRQVHWRPLSRSARWRLFLRSAPWVVLIMGVASFAFETWAWPVLLWLPWSAYAAHRHARHAAWAINERLIAVREGWWSRHWRFAEIDKLQALQLSRNPLDHFCGTATLWLDTAGAGVMERPLRIRFLAEGEARVLHEDLSRVLSRRPLRW